MPKQDAKTTYAQSSSISSRSYLEYRYDMKKKAIAELEILPWLQRQMVERHPKKDVSVKKSGGDAFLWFLRTGGISQKPDFVAHINGEDHNVEFQYGTKQDVYDFKTSKVGKKIPKKDDRVPYNVTFLYLFKDVPTAYAFLPADWIMENGKKGTAPAWGNREVYKIPATALQQKISKDSELAKIWDTIEGKLSLLAFQHELVEMYRDALSHLLEKAIDENCEFKVVPKDLESFFQTCFVINHLERVPENKSLWLVYAASYFNGKNTLAELAKITYCIDFLYGCIVPDKLSRNEISKVTEAIQGIRNTVVTKYIPNQHLFTSDNSVSPIEETRSAIFVLNLIEDMTQDSLFYFSVKYPEIFKNIEPVKKIFADIATPQAVVDGVQPPR